MNAVTVGLVGGGYAAQLHCEAYKKVSGVNVRLKTIVDIDLDKAEKIAEKYKFENAGTSFDELLKDDEIDIIDIVTPPYLHKDMIIKAVNSGKHVICEKPLTGYFGQAGDEEPIGLKVSKEKMYYHVIQEMDEIRQAVENSKKHFMYAENFVYAPNVQKTAQIVSSKKAEYYL